MHSLQQPTRPYLVTAETASRLQPYSSMHTTELLLIPPLTHLHQRIYISAYLLLLVRTGSTLDYGCLVLFQIIGAGNGHSVNCDGCRLFGDNSLGLDRGLLDLLISRVWDSRDEARTTGLEDPMRPKRAASIPIRVKNAAARPAATSGICLQA